MSANAKHVIKQYDAATITAILHREIPDLAIDAIKIIETGWEHLVAEVNGDLIFRFPRSESSLANVEREKRLLDYLKNHITLPIPQYHYTGSDTAFVGYRKIPGSSLSKQLYEALGLDVQHALAKTLALFFTELHHAISKEQAASWGYTPIIRPLEEIESHILGTLPQDIGIMIQQAIAYAKKDLSKEKNVVFFHQDVNGDNLAFNITTKEITGIFDFSDAGIGPLFLGVRRALFHSSRTCKINSAALRTDEQCPQSTDRRSG